MEKTLSDKNEPYLLPAPCCDVMSTFGVWRVVLLCCCASCLVRRCVWFLLRCWLFRAGGRHEGAADHHQGSQQRRNRDRERERQVGDLRRNQPWLLRARCEKQLFPTTTVSTINSNVLIRGTILNRACGTHKSLYISLFLHFYQQYLVLSTIVLRNGINSAGLQKQGSCPAELLILEWVQSCNLNYGH